MPKASNEKQFIGFRAKPSVVADIAARAAALGLSQSSYIRLALNEKYERDSFRSRQLKTKIQTENSAADHLTSIAENFFCPLKSFIALLELVGASAFVKGTNRKLLYANQRALQHLGQSSVDEVIGLAEENLSTTFPQSRTEEDAIFSGDCTHFAATEIRLSRRPSLQFVYTLRIPWLKSDGSVAAVIVIMRDLETAEKESLLKFFCEAKHDDLRADAGVYLMQIVGTKGSAYFDQVFQDREVLDKKFVKKWAKPRPLWKGPQTQKEKAGLMAFKKKAVRPMTNNVHIYDQEKVGDCLYRLFFTADHGHYEKIIFRLWHDENEYRWYEGHGFVHIDEDGTRLIFVSHHELAEGSIAMAVAPLLLEESEFPGRVFVKDEGRRFVYMNRRMLAEFGKTLRHVCGKTDADLGLKGNEARFFQRMDEEILRPGARSWYLIPTETLTVPGRPAMNLITIKMAISAKALNPDAPDDTRYILGISFEATPEWLRTEKASAFWEAFLDRAEDVWYVKNREGKYEFVSKSFCRLAGIADPSSVVGHTADEIWKTNPELIADMKRADEIAFSKGKYIDQKHKETKVPNGPPQQRITTKVRIEDLHKKQYLLGLSRDVTPIIELLSGEKNLT